MKTLNRNKRKVIAANFLGQVPERDTDGLLTGNYIDTYDVPVEYQMNVSAARGEAYQEIFGINLEYDKVLVHENPNIDITENTVLWIDKPYEMRGNTPLNDYEIKRIARSLNSVSIAVFKVNKS